MHSTFIRHSRWLMCSSAEAFNRAPGNEQCRSLRFCEFFFLYTCAVPGARIGSTVAPTLSYLSPTTISVQQGRHSCVVKGDYIKSPFIPAFHVSDQCVFDMPVTSNLHVIYVFKCVFDAIWPMLCWWTIKPTKAKPLSFILCFFLFFTELTLSKRPDMYNWLFQ